MAKVHRAYRHSWWVPSFQQKGWMQDIENGTFGRIPVEARPEGRHVLPFLRSSSDGIPLHVPWNHQAPLPARESSSHRYSERRAEEPGIPAHVDIQEWYAAYLKRETPRTEKQASKIGEEKHDYYRDVALALYRASGHSIEESIAKAYSPQGDDLIRYLADDKRHKLNRLHEDEETEDEEEVLNSALL